MLQRGILYVQSDCYGDTTSTTTSRSPAISIKDAALNGVKLTFSYDNAASHSSLNVIE